MRPVDDLNCHIGGAQYTFLPEKVKPADLPFLLHLFVALLGMKSAGHFDVQGYVDEHGLWHCFKARE